MTLGNVAVVIGMAAAAPLVAARFPTVVPGVVIEILIGLALGPYGLGWVAVDPAVDTLALLGLAFLFFLAGLEIDLSAIRGWLLPGPGRLRPQCPARGGDRDGAAPSGCARRTGLGGGGALRDRTGPRGPDPARCRPAADLERQAVAAAASVAEFSAVVILALGFSSGQTRS